MPRNSRKLAALVLAIGTLLLLGAPPASAAATVYNNSYCQELETFTFCAHEHFEENRVETPSGRLIVQFQARNAYTVAYTDGTTEKAVSTGHVQYMFEPGEMVRYSYHVTDTLTFRGTGETCVYEADYVFAGGEMRVDSNTVTCR